MYKLYCDGCGEEISDTANGVEFKHKFFVSDNDGKGTDADVTVRVIVAFNGTWNAGHICMKCVQDVVNDGVPNKRVTRGGGSNDGDLQFDRDNADSPGPALDRDWAGSDLQQPKSFGEIVQGALEDIAERVAEAGKSKSPFNQPDGRSSSS